MKLNGILQAVAAVLAPQIEVAVKVVIEEKADLAVDFVLTKLGELIPGQIDNTILAEVAPKLKTEFKTYLLAQADKISAKV